MLHQKVRAQIGHLDALVDAGEQNLAEKDALMRAVVAGPPDPRMR